MTGGFACDKSSLDRWKNSAVYGSLEMCSNMARLLQVMVLKRCQATWQALMHEIPQSYSECKMEVYQKTHFDHHRTSTESLKLPVFLIWSIVLWPRGDEEKLYARIKLTLLAWIHFKTYFSWVNTKEIIAGINYLWTEV